MEITEMQKKSRNESKKRKQKVSKKRAESAEGKLRPSESTNHENLYSSENARTNMPKVRPLAF